MWRTAEKSQHLSDKKKVIVGVLSVTIIHYVKVLKTSAYDIKIYHPNLNDTRLIKDGFSWVMSFSQGT